MGTVDAVCSAKPRPSVQRGAKGSQWWKRDVWHIRGEHNRTRCGRDCTEWLAVGEIEMNVDCCDRCAAAVALGDPA